MCRCQPTDRRHVSLRVRITLLALAVIVAWVGVGAARAEVFHSKESALRLAFPGADEVESRSLVISETQAASIRESARVTLPSRLVTVHVGTKAGQVMGYAFIETHNVRSLPETLLVVVTPEGKVNGVHLLAFHEPKEYMPSERWLAQFGGLPLADELALRKGIVGIAGSTLTATAITASVRRILATTEICLLVTDDSPTLSASGSLEPVAGRGAGHD